MTTPALPFHVEVRARFAETDAMGVVHHAAFLPYLEVARVEYLRHLGHPYTRIRDEEGVDLAVIAVDVQYRAPLHFDEVLRIGVGLGEVRRARFAIEYHGERDGTTIVSARTTHAALRDGSPVRLPEWLRALAG